MYILQEACSVLILAEMPVSAIYTTKHFLDFIKQKA
jgi:hypothetical protein